jgi:hypothetical protein
MKTSKAKTFVIAAVLFSSGCVALLAHTFFAITMVCFCLPPVVLMTGLEASRPVPHREGVLDRIFSISLIVIFVAMLTLIFLGKLQVQFHAFERVIRHPAFVASLWMPLMAWLCWRWRKERRISDV